MASDSGSALTGGWWEVLAGPGLTRLPVNAACCCCVLGVPACYMLVIVQSYALRAGVIYACPCHHCAHSYAPLNFVPLSDAR